MSNLSEIRNLFGPSGRLSSILPDYDLRPQQLEMSEQILQGLAEGRHLLVEAGTGTGKTLAYLAPAILSGKKVVVSTGTKALQEQLYYKDVPLIRKALSQPFRAAYMKGRSNYLCLNRFHEFGLFPLFDTPEQGTLFKKIQSWVGKTATGDGAELSEAGEGSPLWRQINSTTETCLGGKCPELDRCFITRMRREAVMADLLIVNHHLFFADISVKEKGYGEVIPDYDAVIFDEAHMIEDVATHHFGRQVSNYRVAELVRDTHRGLRELKDEKGVQKIRENCDDIEEASGHFFTAFMKGADRERLLWDAGNKETSNKEAGLTRLLNHLHENIKGAAHENENLASCLRRAGEIAADLEVILNGDDPALVYWREVRGKGVFLHASPIDISEELRSRIFERIGSVSLTSATLTAGGSFEFIKKRLGLLDAGEVSLPSPFDYASQAVLYLPKMTCDPNGPDFIQEAAGQIRTILQKTRGRALILFTSHRNLHAVYGVLEDQIDYTLLKQGGSSREALLSQFREEKESVLFATRSFWQGIDVQGDALSCVIIDKLPFAVPTEPVVAARIDAIRKRGGNPFLEYQVPEAAITLKQGFGRLIRNRKDRGVLSILDKRINTRFYGKFFIRSLPNCPVTHDVEDMVKVFSDGVVEKAACEGIENSNSAAGKH